MKTFGLIGNPLSHSHSQNYFTNKFLQENICDAEYQLFPLKNIEEIAALLKHPTLLGFNVTIPYKSAIIPFLDEIDTVAQDIGAVNCVVKENGRWIGYNTDVVGFEKTICDIRLSDYPMCDMRQSYNHQSTIENQMITHFISEAGNRKSDNRMSQISNLKSHISNLVLGSGGAAKSVGYVLKQKNIPFQIVSLKKTDKTIMYNEVTAELVRQTTLIINTTPLGMFPNIDKKPTIPYSALHSNHILIDLIYNPEETLFLKEGKKRGAVIINGLTMFEAQAEASYLKFKI